MTHNAPNKIGYLLWHETSLFCTAMVLLFYENAFHTFIGSTEMGELLSSFREHNLYPKSKISRPLFVCLGVYFPSLKPPDGKDNISYFE